MKLKELFDAGLTTLISVLGSENSQEIESNVYFLLTFLLNKNISEIKQSFNEPISKSIEDKFFQFIERRLLHEPVQYITEETEFFSIDYIVKKNVLVPRIDSEVLVEAVLDTYKQKEKLLFLDLCTGTGCLGISVLLNLKNSFCYFIDISDDAINNTILNLKKHNLMDRAKVIKSNLFNELENEKFDFIISNPPYIEDITLNSLALEISLYEPKLALAGGKNGLDFYKIIEANAKKFLKQDGKIFLEIAYNKASEISKLFKTYKNHKLIKDYSAQDRVFVAEF